MSTNVITRDQVSAGGVAFRRAGSGLEMVIVSVKRSVRWQLPRGIVAPGETPEVTAVREVREEGGEETRAIIGAYFITFGSNLPDFTTGDKTTIAALLALIAALAFGSSTVLSKRALRNVSFEMGTYLRFLFSALIMLVLVVSLGDISSITEITTKQIIIFLIIAFTTGGAGIFLYYFGLKRIAASIAAICELAFPLTAVLLQYFLRGNILDAVQWMGAGVLLLSILKVSLNQNQ